MSQHPQDANYECCLLRYVPNVLSGEFLNIGLMMCDSILGEHSFADLRFRQDWSRVLQFDPDADVEVLAAVCSEISAQLQDAADRAIVKRKLENSLANIIQMSDRWIVRVGDPAREMDRLAEIYFGSAPPVPQRVLPNMFERVSAYRERPLLTLPLWGMVAAGQPIEAVQSPETISLEDIVGKKKCFVLKVRGESMQDEHIVDGDYVLLEKTKKASNGDIVVALVDGYDATLKRFYLQGDTIRLQPSNVNMAPIIVAAEAVQIQGKVIGVLRKY
jgi:SOS-response transcriptional repressor LexA